MAKIKLFTHGSDLDGVGCAILAILAYGKENVDIEYCEYTNINKKVQEFINEYPIIIPYDEVFITDISVSEETAEMINAHADKFSLIDHHQTAEWLEEKYGWAYVRTVQDDGKKSSGTSLFYYTLLYRSAIDPNKSHKEFIETVRSYDTYDWKESGKYECKQWSDLLKILGREKFIERIVARIKLDLFIFAEDEKQLLEIEQNRIDRYIDFKEKKMVRRNVLGYNAGIVFAERYVSELGNQLSEHNPDLDFIAIVDPSYGVSYRTVKDDINLGEDVAKFFGGGGHPKAAGNQLPVNFVDHSLYLLFGEE